MKVTGSRLGELLFIMCFGKYRLVLYTSNSGKHELQVVYLMSTLQIHEKWLTLLKYGWFLFIYYFFAIVYTSNKNWIT